MPSLEDKGPRRPVKPAYKVPPKKGPKAPVFSDDDDDDEEPEVPVLKVVVEDIKPGEDDRTRRIRILTETPDEDLDMIKKWSCSFYRPDNPKCTGCRQPEDIVLECRDYYLERINMFPLITQWAPSFDLPVVKIRPKVALKDLSNVGINCDSCYMSEKCPHYEKNSTCGIDFGTAPENLTTSKVYDTLIELQHERVNRQSTYERIDGGVADGNLSVEIDRLERLVNGKENRNTPTFKMTVEGSGDAGVKESGGLLSRIFAGALGPKKEDEMTTIDIPYAEPEFVEEKKPTKRLKSKSE